MLEGFTHVVPLAKVGCLTGAGGPVKPEEAAAIRAEAAVRVTSAAENGRADAYVLAPHGLFPAPLSPALQPPGVAATAVSGA